jgi:hypothetical protein
LGFSYGFRPRRSAHDALDALTVGINTQRVRWLLDADIQGFFDNIDHEWLLRLLEHEIADRRMLRLIQKWLKAGVSEDGEWSETNVGTPQGAVISPLLANVYLHNVFDLWVQAWRKKVAKGRVIVVRYADDFVLGFELRADAERFLEELRERLGKFGLELHPAKTRLIEFGRWAIADRRKRGAGKPETFARNRGVAAVGGFWIFPLPRSAGKSEDFEWLSTRGGAALAVDAATEEPEGSDELGTFLSVDGSLFAAASYLSSVSEREVCGHASEVRAV